MFIFFEVQELHIDTTLLGPLLAKLAEREGSGVARSLDMEGFQVDVLLNSLQDLRQGVCVCVSALEMEGIAFYADLFSLSLSYPFLSLSISLSLQPFSLLFSVLFNTHTHTHTHTHGRTHTVREKNDKILSEQYSKRREMEGRVEEVNQRLKEATGKKASAEEKLRVCSEQAALAAGQASR